MAVAVRQCWLPEILEVNVSADLVPELQAHQESILARVADIKRQHGIVALFRIRDDALLANKTLAISVNGIRIAGRVIERTAHLQTELSAAIESVCSQHADAIRFFADLHSTAPQ